MKRPPAHSVSAKPSADEELQEREEERVEPREAEVAAPELAVVRVEAGRLALLAGERAHEPLTREVLLRLGRNLAEELLDLREALVRGLAHDLRRDRDHRENGERHARQCRRHAEHEDERHRAHEKGVAGLHDPGPEQHADGGEVVDGAAHEVADAVPAVPHGRQAQEVREEVLAHLVFDVPRGADEEAARQEERDRVADGQEHDEGRQAEEPLRRDAGAELLDGPPHEARHREEKARRCEHRSEAGEVHPGPAAKVGEETGEVSHPGKRGPRCVRPVLRTQYTGGKARLIPEHHGRRPPAEPKLCRG